MNRFPLAACTFNCYGFAPVDEQRKQAYRWLLYWATLEIRPLRWIGQSWRDWLNPMRWLHYSRRVRMSGALADWLHNLAMFSALDFHDFDEERFWRDYEWFEKNYPSVRMVNYRDEFSRCAESRIQ